MGKTPRAIVLSAEQKKELEVASNGLKVERRIAMRAKIVLLLYSGHTFAQVQATMGVARAVVTKWKNRYLLLGFAGLVDKSGRGKERQFDAFDESRVLELASSKPPGGYTNWSQARIAKELGMSKATVQRILARQQLKPHKVEYWCGKSTDPEFEAKMTNIVGLYLNPPENALVISVDEKTQIQALDRSQPELPLRAGQPRRQTATYKRNGVVALIAALALHNGEVTADAIESNNSANFLRFLKRLLRKYPHKHLHVIVDNLAVHKHKSVKEWLAAHKGRITLHFTPTYSSWLNQIEIWFNILSKDVLKGGIWKSRQELVEALMEYIKTYNQTRARPFQWTYNGKPKIGSPSKESTH